jgi:hypothetical protein
LSLSGVVLFLVHRNKDAKEIRKKVKEVVKKMDKGTQIGEGVGSVTELD